MSPDNEETTPTTPATEVTEATETSTPTVTEETAVEETVTEIEETPTETASVDVDLVPIDPSNPDSPTIAVPPGTPVVDGAYERPDAEPPTDIEVGETITLGGQEINPDDLSDAQIQGILAGAGSEAAPFDAGTVGATLAPVTEFAALSVGLPADHWLFDKHAPVELPRLGLTREQSDGLRHYLVQAAQHAVRDGTNYGTSNTFDPDRLVQHVVASFYNPDARQVLELPSGEDGVVPSDEISQPISQEQELINTVADRLAKNTGFKREIATIAEAIRQDHGYAWSWHCNLAVAILDTHIPHPRANRAAAEIMSRVFKMDTTTFPEYADTQLEAPAE